jgi:hypothetical protein
MDDCREPSFFEMDIWASSEECQMTYLDWLRLFGEIT